MGLASRRRLTSPLGKLLLSRVVLAGCVEELNFSTNTKRERCVNRTSQIPITALYSSTGRRKWSSPDHKFLPLSKLFSSFDRCLWSAPPLPCIRRSCRTATSRPALSHSLHNLHNPNHRHRRRRRRHLLRGHRSPTPAVPTFPLTLPRRPQHQRLLRL